MECVNGVIKTGYKMEGAGFLIFSPFKSLLHLTRYLTPKGVFVPLRLNP